METVLERMRREYPIDFIVQDIMDSLPTPVTGLSANEIAALVTQKVNDSTPGVENNIKNSLDPDIVAAQNTAQAALDNANSKTTMTQVNAAINFRIDRAVEGQLKTVDVEQIVSNHESTVIFPAIQQAVSDALVDYIDGADVQAMVTDAVNNAIESMNQQNWNTNQNLNILSSHVDDLDSSNQTRFNSIEQSLATRLIASQVSDMITEHYNSVVVPYVNNTITTNAAQIVANHYASVVVPAIANAVMDKTTIGNVNAAITKQYNEVTTPAINTAVAAGIADRLTSSQVSTLISNHFTNVTMPAITSAVADKVNISQVNSAISTYYNSTIVPAINAAVSDKLNTAQVNALIATAIADRPTTSAMNTAITAAVNSGKTNAYVDGVLKGNFVQVFATATTSGGKAVFNLVKSGTSTPIFDNEVFLPSIDCWVLGTGLYKVENPVVSADRKTLTVDVKAISIVSALLSILAAGNGLTVYCQVAGR